MSFADFMNFIYMLLQMLSNFFAGQGGLPS